MNTTQEWLNLILEGIIILGAALWITLRYWLRRKNSQLNVEGKAYDVFCRAMKRTKNASPSLKLA